MTNHTSLQFLKHLSLAIVAALTIIFGVAFSAASQDRPVFKVGDRVEVDPLARAISYKYKKWRKATVIKVGPSGGGVDSYVVKIDAEGDSGSEIARVMTDEDMDMIRPLQEAEKKGAKNDAENAAEKDVKNGAADRENKGEPKKVDAKPAATTSRRGTNAAALELPGTAWAFLSMTKKGSAVKNNDVPPTVNFCHDGKWVIYHYGGRLEAGSYQVRGSRLVMKADEVGSFDGDYTMTLDGDILTLDDGEYVVRFKADGKVDC